MIWSAAIVKSTCDAVHHLWIENHHIEAGLAVREALSSEVLRRYRETEDMCWHEIAASLLQFEAALKTIKALGATVVDPADLPSAQEIVRSNNETFVLNVDFKVNGIAHDSERILLMRL